MMNDGGTVQTIGRYVKSVRQSRNLSIADAVEHSGLSESYWRKLEAGQYASPDPKYLQVIAETISCPLQDLYQILGFPLPDELPSLVPYLRATSTLSDDDIAVMARIFDTMQQRADNPDRDTDRRAA